MPNVITTAYVNQIQFYQMPKVFFHHPKYVSMYNESKLAYMLLRDLLPLSIENNWVNENNEVFVKLSREKLMTLLNIKGTQKITQIMKELVTCGLIIYKRVGLAKCNEIYVCIPDDMDAVGDEEAGEILEEPMKDEKQPSDNLKNISTEVSKSNARLDENQTHINTNTINTNIKKTNKNHSFSPSLNTLPNPVLDQKSKETEGKKNSLTDEKILMEDLEAVRYILKEQVYVEDLKQRYDPEFVDEIANNICEMYLNENTPIGHGDKPRGIMRGVIRKLQMYHIEHVIDQFHKAAAQYEIYNPKKYIQTMIYNSVYEANTKMKGDIRYKFGY